MIYPQQKYFDILWDKAIPAGEKIKEIEELEIQQLKVLENPFEIQNMLINLLQSVYKDIWLLVSSYTIIQNIQKFSDILTILYSFEEKIKVRILILTINNEPKKSSEEIQI